MQEPEITPDDVVPEGSALDQKAARALAKKIERDSKVAALLAEAREKKRLRQLTYMPRKNTPKDQREIVRHGPALPLTTAGITKLGHAPRGRKRG